MDGKGGCCIARYGGGNNSYDPSRMDRIMRRFRPIAPKPATNSSGSVSSSTEKNIPCARKRRYVRNRKRNESSDGNSASVAKRQKICKNGKSRKTISSSPEENVSGGRCYAERIDAVVTLSLLPETPEREDSLPARGFSSGVERVPLWLNFGSPESENVDVVRSDGKPGMVAQPSRVVGTWVHVECVTTTWGEEGCGYGGGMGMGMGLESDTCPGFVSDGYGRVVWVNRAYREMVAGCREEEDEEEEVLVWLVFKDGLRLPTPPPPPTGWQGFTCTVRVVTCGKEKSSRTVPCDVWRLEGGRGFAWRLDITAALSLSL